VKVPRIIELLPYDPRWSDQYQHEANHIAEIFAEHLVAIHHIGSTAIPGIKAKPVIDIMVIVREIEQVEQFNQAMIDVGYIPRGEHGIPGRRYFRKGSDDHHSHHVHVYGLGHQDIMLQLNFRDYLRDHPMEAQAYSQLKEALAQQYREDPAGYTEGKTEFVVERNQRAAQWREQQNNPG
jgi:GrpB-like predicted nucleotidyltransferase (UPF0157 family)